jgi:hypothetical protein
MIQSHDIIDSVTIKKAKKPADHLKFFVWLEISEELSWAIEYFLEMYL